MPRGSRRLLGKVFEPFWLQGAPEVSQGRPETKKSRKQTSRPSPEGPCWEFKFGLFVDFVGLCSYCFLSVVLEGLQVEVSVDLGRLLVRFLNIFN